MRTTTRIARLLLPVLASVGIVTSASANSAGATPPTDLVLIPALNIDFGDGVLGPNNDPIVPGLLEWDTSGGTITPHLTGRLFLKNALGLHARMQMRYYDVFGNVLATKVGGEVWASTNGTHTWTVDLDPYSNPAIYKVVVSTTYKLGNDWYTKASQTVYI